MNEQTPHTDVDLAFNDYEKRMAQRDLDAYLAGRPYQDEKGGVHHPETNAFINSDEHFDAHRDTIAAEEGAKMSEGYAYEDMSVTELARKLAAAEFVRDRTTAGTIQDELDNRLDAMDDKFYSERDKDGTNSTRPENKATDNNEVRSENLEDRVMKIKDRELARLKAEHTEKDDREGDHTGHEEAEGAEDDASEAVVADDTDEHAEEAAPEDDQDSQSSEHTSESNEAEGAEDDASEAETEVLDGEIVDEDDEDEAAEEDEVQGNEQEQLGEQFEQALARWSTKLQDSRYVPTPNEYQAMVAMAERIELRHKDPEADGQSGMGYFVTGSDTPLNSYQARTLLDKSKVREWAFVDQQEERIANSILNDSEPEDLSERTARAEQHRELLTFMPFDSFVKVSKKAAKEAESDNETDYVDNYHAYVNKRIGLDEYLRDHDVEPYQVAATKNGIDDFRKETKESRRSFRGIAARGLRRVAQKARESREKLRREQAEQETPAEEEPTEEKPAA